MRAPKFFAIAVCGIFLMLSGCGPIGDEGSGGGGTDNNLGGGIGGSGDGGAGELQVVLVGRENPWIDALTITLDQIDLHRSEISEDEEDGDWVSFDVASQRLDILTLIDGEHAVVLDERVDAAIYDKVRVRLEYAEVSVMGETYEVKLTSNGQDIEHPTFGLAIDDDGLTQVTLDFDPLASLRWNRGGGHYLLNPELSIVVAEEMGSISGFITPSGIGAVVGAFDHKNGKLLAAASARRNGSFIIPRLWVTDVEGKERRYDLRAFAFGYFTEDSYDKVSVVGGADVGGYEFDFEQEDEDDEDGKKEKRDK